MLLPPLLAKPLNPQQACLSKQSVPPAPPTTFQKCINMIPITRSLYVLLPRPGTLFPSLLAKAAPLFSPKIQQKHYLFRVSSPRPIPDCLPSYNRIDYSLVYLDGPLVSEVCTSLWPVSPWECDSTGAGGRGLCGLSSASQSLAQHPVSTRPLTWTRVAHYANIMPLNFGVLRWGEKEPCSAQNQWRTQIPEHMY